MNETDRELAAVKERMITLERRIAALEKQLDEVDSQTAFERKYLQTARKSLFRGFLISMIFTLLVILAMLIWAIINTL